MVDVAKLKNNPPWLFHEINIKSLTCLYTVLQDAISTGKIPEIVWLRLVFPRRIYPVEMTSSIRLK